MARPGPFLTDDPSGTRLIASTPHPMATSTVPEPMRLAARLVACWLDPHWLSTVVAAVEMGMPAASQAVRPMLNDCSPAWLTQPVTTCSTTAGSMPDRAISDSRTAPSRSAGCLVERPPPRRPMGLRTASMTTTSVMRAAYLAAPSPAQPAHRLTPPATPLDRVQHEQQQARADDRNQQTSQRERPKRDALDACGPG